MNIPQKIHTEILKKLEEIEKSEDVRILHCVESGSRAWGFSSPDSDFDVRFIYVRNRNFYLKLEKTRDVIDWQLDDTLDINGWDVQKALRLIYKSNLTAFEWNNSPIIYKTSPEWHEIGKIIDGFFSVKSGVNHYLSLAKSTNTAYLKHDFVRLKKYFYAIRPILACKWIFQNKTPPPMLFSDLVESQLPLQLKPEIEKLLARKVIAQEKEKIPQIQIINDFIENEIEIISNKISAYSEERVVDFSILNNAFLRLLSLD